MATDTLHFTKQRPHLTALRHGDPSGPKVLALHGWLDNAASFDGLVAELPELNIVALDFPGHGYSEHRSPDAGYSFLEWVPEVFRVADELGWSKLSLLGHSMGAAAASLAAGTFPERIERVVAIEGLAPLTAPESEAASRFHSHLEQRARLKTKQPAVYATVEEAVEARLKAGGFESAAVVEAMVRRSLQKTPAGYSWRGDPRLRLPSMARMTPPMVRSFLARITAPVLVVKADRGLPVDEVEYAGYVQAVKSLQLVKLPGGHHLHMEAPGAVAKAVRGFFGPALRA